MRIVCVAVACAALLATAAPPVAAQHEHGSSLAEQFGTVHFPTSCDTSGAAGFERAVAMLHSFAYAPAARAFAAIAARDPGCPMAQWGIAMSYFHTVWGPPTPDEFAAGRAASRRADSLAAHADARDRDWIAATHAYYAGDDAPHATRVEAFESAMAGVAQRYPDDHEAQVFHALALLAVAYNSPPDKSYARQKQAAAILNRLLPLEPRHPGIAHYMIHSFDYPELADLALPAARAYSKLAPASPHALHMPSHIYTRLGLWRESVAANIASARLAQGWVARTRPGATAFDAMHAMDYLEYAYLQLGQDAAARAIVDSARAAHEFDVASFQAGYALAAIPTRYALERRAWSDAAALELPAAFPWARYPYEEAIVHFGRAVGAARSGDVEGATRAVARLEQLHASLAGQKGFDWATQVEIQRRAAAGWLARAGRHDDDAIALLRSAADLEDATDKHPVTPGPVLPAREQLADLLLELDRPAAALVEYRASMRGSPARLGSYLGAAEAAERAGHADEATDLRAHAVVMCGGAVPARPRPGPGAAR